MLTFNSKMGVSIVLMPCFSKIELILLMTPLRWVARTELKSLEPLGVFVRPF